MIWESIMYFCFEDMKNTRAKLWLHNSMQFKNKSRQNFMKEETEETLFPLFLIVDVLGLAQHEENTQKEIGLIYCFLVTGSYLLEFIHVAVIDKLNNSEKLVVYAAESENTPQKTHCLVFMVGVASVCTRMTWWKLFKKSAPFYNENKQRNHLRSYLKTWFETLLHCHKWGWIKKQKCTMIVMLKFHLADIQRHFTLHYTGCW